MTDKVCLDCTVDHNRIEWDPRTGGVAHGNTCGHGCSWKYPLIGGLALYLPGRLDPLLHLCNIANEEVWETIV